MIFTFYSFKGGVGRSMMLANAAELLCQRGLNVLMVDFDLEAPGLERFFSRAAQTSQGTPTATGFTLPDHADLVRTRGVVDLLISYKTLQALPPPKPKESEESATSSGESASTPSIPFHVEPLNNFIVPIRTSTKPGEGTLSLMPAGRRDDNEYSLYAERVRAFEWEDFYIQWRGARFFDWFGEQLRNTYDVVLIDSRTGITEMSGVCTHQLADAVVLFAAANEQNLEGTQRMARSLAREELVESRGGRALATLIVPSRVELAEGQKLKEFSDKFAALAEMIDKRIKFRTGAFLDLRVPYVPYYAFGENVAVREPDLPIAADMIAAATRICSAMMELVPKDSPAYSRYQAAQANLPRLAETSAFAEPPADFAGRDWVFEATGKWLSQPSSPTMLIVGAPGSGKTALAARMVAAADDRTILGGKLRLAGLLVLAHSCRAEEGWRPFMEKLVRVLAARWPVYVAAVARAAASIPAISVRTQQRISSASDQPSAAALSLESITISEGVSHETAFTALVRQPLVDANLSGAATAMVPALVLVDGLDEVLSSDKETVADLLAAAVRSGWPSGLKLLMLSRPDSRILRMSDNVLKLDVDANLVKPDIVAYADLRLGKQLGPKELELVTEQIATAAAGNFLYARTVLDAVLENAEDSSAILANVDKILKLDQIPQKLHRLYAAMIQQEVGLDTERWSTYYRPVLGVLAVAPEGFTADELAGITGWPRSEISDSLRLMQSLVVEQLTSRQIRLFHPSFAAFLLTDTEYGVSAVEAHEKVASYFVGQYAEHWTKAPDPAVQDVDRYLIQAIKEATDRRKSRQLGEQLAELLLDATFVEAKLARGKGPDIRLGIATCLQTVPTDHPHRDELGRLDLVLRGRDQDLLARMRENPRWLPAQLSPLPDIIPPDGPPSPDQSLSEESNTISAPPIPMPEDFVTDDMLRRQIPTRVRIDLTVARRARMMGLIMLAIGLSLTATLLAGRVLYSSSYSDLLVGAYALTVISAGYLGWIAWEYSRMKPYYGSSESEGDWEKLPEIIALRAQRYPYRLLGNVSVASPYFEITLIVLVVGVIVGTVSNPVDLLRYFAGVPVSRPTQVSPLAPGIPGLGPAQVSPSKAPQ